MAQEKKSGGLPYFNLIVVVVSLVVGWLLYSFVLGAGSNFVGGSNDNQPLNGSILATMYKGGFIVPILIAVLLIVLTFAIERLLTIMSAKGKGSVEAFVRKVRELLSNGDIDTAIAECDKQRGSIANVVRSGLVKFEQVEKEGSLDKEAKNCSYPEITGRSNSARTSYAFKKSCNYINLRFHSNPCGSVGYSIRYDKSVCRYGAGRRSRCQQTCNRYL